MTRRLLTVASVVFVALLVATAPVAASHTATASEHTTDSDFNNAATLENLDISGTGEDATLELTPTVKSDSVARNADTGSATVTSTDGIVVVTGDRELENVTAHRSSQTTGQFFRLLDENENQLESGIIDDGRFEFNTTLQPNTKYYIALDQNGDEYETGQDFGWDGETYTSEYLNITSGYHSDFSDPEDRNPANIRTVDYDYVETDPAQYTSGTHDASDIEQGYANLTLDGVDATVEWQAHDGSSWTTIDTATHSTSDEHTAALAGNYEEWRVDIQFNPTSTQGTATLSSEGVRFTSAPPALDNQSAEPSGGEEVSSSPVTLQIDVNDDDFETVQGDTVTLEWYHNGEHAGTTTHTEAETASIDSSESVAGDNEWYVVATDEYDHETTSETFTFSSPSELTIRDVHTGDVIDEAEIRVQFYHSDDVVVEETTTDGTVDLSGIGAETDILVDAATDDYHDRSIIIESIWDQQEMYLLPDNAETETVQPRFRLNDPSGQFVEAESDLFIQRPLNHTTDTTQWVTVAADEFGAEGYTTWLEEGERYRLILRNEQGDRRTVGSYRPAASETVELEVEGIEFGFTLGDEPIEYDISYNDDVNEIRFAYRDHDDATDWLDLRIYEQGNESNVLVTETWSPGNDIQYDVPADNGTNWVVEFEAHRDGETLTTSRVVGTSRLGVGPDIDPRWSTIAGMGLLIVVAGMFGRGRPEVGAVAVSLLGGILWLIGWMPGATTGAMIVVGMFVSILFYVTGGGPR